MEVLFAKWLQWKKYASCNEIIYFYPSAISRRGIAMSMSVGLSVGLLTPQFSRSTGRISWSDFTIFGLWLILGSKMR